MVDGCYIALVMVSIGGSREGHANYLNDLHILNL